MVHGQIHEKRPNLDIEMLFDDLFYLLGTADHTRSCATQLKMKERERERVEKRHNKYLQKNDRVCAKIEVIIREVNIAFAIDNKQ